MDQTELTRRDFLEGTGKAAGVMVVTLATGTALMASDGAWAMDLRALSGETAETLLRMTRALYPHDMLSDQYYAVVVSALDDEAKESGEVAAMMKDGAASLDAAFGMPFSQLSEGNQVLALQSLETTPFFQKVRAKVVGVLYNNPRVWQAFGYEGASFDEGGYIERGFDDLAWLPNPPEDASPAKA